MSMIGKEVSEFSVQAFHDNSFKTVSKDLTAEGGEAALVHVVA